MARLPTNVEPSAFNPGAYIIYAGDGHVWYARKLIRDWKAAPAANNPARYGYTSYRAGTLTALATLLSARVRPATTLDERALTTV